MAHNIFAPPGWSPRSPERQHQHLTERFQVLPAKEARASHTRLTRERRRIPLRDNDTFVSTTIAPNGWLAAATSSEIRVYDVENQDLTKAVKPYTTIRMTQLSKCESVRGIAISNDLLAVVTHRRLVVYEYLDNRNIESNYLEEVYLDLKAAWTPRSVSILQAASSDTYQSSAAWVAIGGEGVNGVKLYQYSKTSSWNVHAFRLNLKCPQNTGTIYDVGFSKFVSMNCFVVYAVTSENRVVCWKVQASDIDSPKATSRTQYDANATQSPSPHRGEITSVEIFETPSKSQYIFVAINQKHGSQLIRSFIAPLAFVHEHLPAAKRWRRMRCYEHVFADFVASLSGSSAPKWRPLPDKIAGRQVLSAAVTSNGRFLVLAEKGRMRALTLRAAYEGGLTCLEQAVEWSSPLCDTAKDTSAITLSLRENSSCFAVTGIDGRGHLTSARITVPAMLPSAPPSLRWCPPVVATELRSSISVKELAGKAVRSATRVDSTVSEWDELSDQIQVMLGS